MATTMNNTINQPSTNIPTNMILSDIINVILYAVAFISNAIGLFLLWKVEESPRFSCTQRVYLLNICVCDLVTSALYIAIRFLYSYFPYQMYLYRMTTSGLYFWYIGLMTLMTLDRFLSVYLNIRYPLVWSYRKTKIALLLLFLVSVVITIPFYCLEERLLHYVISLYYWPFLDLTFVVVGVVTYSYFFLKIRGIRSRQNILKASVFHSCRPSTDAVSLSTMQPAQQHLQPQQLHSQQQQQLPPSEQKNTQKRNILIKIKRGFFTPTLLVVNFCIFWLIPDQLSFWDIMCVYKHHKPFLPMGAPYIIVNLYPFGFISDAIIYIFFQKEVFLYLKRKSTNLVKVR